MSDSDNEAYLSARILHLALGGTLTCQCQFAEIGPSECTCDHDRSQCDLHEGEPFTLYHQHRSPAGQVEYIPVRGFGGVDEAATYGYLTDLRRHEVECDGIPR